MRRLLIFALTCLCLGVASGSLSQQARPNGNGENGENGEAVDPHADPSQPHPDEGYDPYTDADHPLKDGDRDPGEAWQRHRRSDGTPPVKGGEARWDWKELFYDGTYPTKLVVTNKCPSPQMVSIFVTDLPYLTIPNIVVVPASSQKEVEATIKTPPEPPAPTPPPGGPPPPWGWVKPPPPQPFGAPQFHQPNFVQIGGEVVVWHPWVANCQPKREVYDVAGHIHFRPPQEDSGPSSLAETDVCTLYWNLGVPPDQLGDEDCTERIRELALHYRTKIVARYAEDDPASWAWLPSPEAIGEMSIDELLAMKANGDALMGRESQ